MEGRLTSGWMSTPWCTSVPASTLPSRARRREQQRGSTSSFGAYASAPALRLPLLFGLCKVRDSFKCGDRTLSPALPKVATPLMCLPNHRLPIPGSRHHPSRTITTLPPYHRGLPGKRVAHWF